MAADSATVAGRFSFENPPRVNPESLQLFRDFKDSLRPCIPTAVEVLGEFLAGRETQMPPQDEFVSLSTATFQFFKYIFDFHHLKEQDILMAMGGTGTGKSTMQAHLRGCEVKRVTNERVVGNRKVKKVAHMVDSPHVGHSLVGSATYEPHVHAPVEIAPFGRVTLVDFPGFSDSRSNAFNFGFLAAYKYFNRHAKSCRVVGCTTSIYKDREHLKGEMKKLLAMVLCTPGQSPHARLFVSLNYPSNDEIDMCDISAVQPSLAENKIGFGRLALNNLEFEPPLKNSLGVWLVRDGTCTPKAIMTGDPRTEAHAIFLKEDEKSHMGKMVNELLLGEQIKAFLNSFEPAEKFPSGKEVNVADTQEGISKLPLAELAKHVESVTVALQARSQRASLISHNLRTRRQIDSDEHGALKTLALHDVEWFPNLAPLVRMDIPEVLLAAIDVERDRIWNPCLKLLTDETRKQLEGMKALLEQKDIVTVDPSESTTTLDPSEPTTAPGRDDEESQCLRGLRLAFGRPGLCGTMEPTTAPVDTKPDPSGPTTTTSCNFLGLTEELTKLKERLARSEDLLTDREAALSQIGPSWKELEYKEMGALVVLFAGAVTGLCLAAGSAVGASIHFGRDAAKQKLKGSLKSCLEEILESIDTLEKTTAVVDSRVKGLENLQRTLQAVISAPHDHASKCQCVEIQD